MPTPKEKAVPQSFDFGGEALRPDYVVKCSYGNDSIALLQFLHEYNQKHPLGKVAVLYNNTGWAAKWWAGRVENGEKLARSFGFIPAHTDCKGMRQLIFERRSWPRQQARFCTEVLKILPTLSWLAINDPDGTSTLVCGVRREESAERRNWPEWVDSHATNEGRPQWSPLAYVDTAGRDALIKRAGWRVLPHRSRECKCILANSTDLKTFKESDIQEIEETEAFAETRTNPPNSYMFDPSDKKGRPKGIRAVIEWAKNVKTKEPAKSGCDSGYCVG